MKPVQKPVGVMRRKYRTTESAGGDDTFLHLRLTAEDRERVRAILGFMLDDPEADKCERVSKAGAVRYAMRLCVERPPAHVKVRA